MEEKDHLLASLSEEHRRSILIDSYYLAGYDPPLKLFFRRNEIWFIIARASIKDGKTTNTHHGGGDNSAATAEETLNTSALSGSVNNIVSIMDQ